MALGVSSGLSGCPDGDRIIIITGAGGTIVTTQGGEAGGGNGNEAGGGAGGEGDIGGSQGGSSARGGDAGTGGTAATGGSGRNGGTGGIGGADGKTGGTGGITECRGARCSCFGDAGDECADGPCCRSMPVTGGSFRLGRSGAESVSASLDDYGLDEFEVTVGRFRKFVEAYIGAPQPDAGEHPFVVASGWQSPWDSFIAVTPEELASDLSCHASQATWTAEPGDNETRPINCVTWFEAFAFCAWDGGRLPTEAEWEYAASGGDEGVEYPWGDDSPTYDHAVFDCSGKTLSECEAVDLPDVGSKPDGAGLYSQADLAGSLSEWVLDWHASYVEPCNNCAKVDSGSERVTRGGSFLSATDADITAAVRTPEDPGVRLPSIGFRCARDD